MLHNSFKQQGHQNGVLKNQPEHNRQFSMKVCILGAGAFGTALALALSSKHNISLWGRNSTLMHGVAKSRESPRLPGIVLNSNIDVTSEIESAAKGADFILSVIPLQATHETLKTFLPVLLDVPLIGCSKGLDLQSGLGGYSILRKLYPLGPVGLLTGPSFADDVARGLPTALTLAADPKESIGIWQSELSTNALRLYASHDPVGAELGGALKNVIAIACGVAIGAGLGESARAALITRGNTEIGRFAISRGARIETLTGLSGFGDLCLTCTSEKSRNYQYGLALGHGNRFDSDITVEGFGTAMAMQNIIHDAEIEMPITKAVADLCSGRLTVSETLTNLMTRPLREEF